MSALYYVLGEVAKLNARLWRIRINFLPINVLIMVGMLLFGLSMAEDAVESTHNAKSPLKISVSEIGEAARVPQNYVAVTGIDYPVAMYEYGEESSSGDIKTVSMSWTPLFDADQRRILLVRRPGKAPGGESREATVTGMLWKLAPDIRDRLAARNNAVDGVPVETRYMLVEGERPSNAMNSALISVLLFIALIPFVIVSVKRNTIFQRMELAAPITKPKPVDSLDVGSTGVFSLHQEKKVIDKRFVDMPSVLVHLDDGSPALVSNIDATSRFMGVKLEDRAGLWTIGMKPKSVHATQAGYLYWGMKRRPACRFSFTSARNGKTAQAIVTADDVQTLRAAVAMLTTPAERRMPATG